MWNVCKIPHSLGHITIFILLPYNSPQDISIISTFTLESCCSITTFISHTHLLGCHIKVPRWYLSYRIRTMSEKVQITQRRSSLFIQIIYLPIPKHTHTNHGCILHLGEGANVSQWLAAVVSSCSCHWLNMFDYCPQAFFRLQEVTSDAWTFHPA